MKLARHEKIIELIKEYDIDTQEELAVRVHSVAYHSCLRRMDAEHLESRAHHERIGLTDENST